jgi:hypothetical protein
MTTLFHQLIKRLTADAGFRHAFLTGGTTLLEDTSELSAEDQQILRELQQLWRTSPDSLVSIPDWDGRAARASINQPG